jgi:multidrug efflux pump subunit AcrB
VWIVRLALRRPYTVATFCLLIMLLGVLSVLRMRTDVLPSINIPVVVVVWSYNGLSAEDMERRVTLVAERGYSTTVDNIEHMDSESMSGIGIIRMYMDPDADIGGAIAQVSAQSMQSLRFMPTGMTPPNILQFNASNVPVAQITLSSNSIPGMEIFDYTQNFLRLRLFTIPGLQSPPPYGGTGRQVSVDLDLAKLAEKQLAPADAVQGVLASNVILPAGTVRVGQREYDVELNGSPSSYEEFNRIPLKVVNGATVYLGDVANVHDGSAVVTNTVHVNGERAAYLAILKKSNASTITVVDAAKNLLPTLRAAAPEGLEIKLDFDQSVFVRSAIKGVLREAAISGGLVALMILGFLGSWRGVVICCASIPLAIFCGVIGLFLTGNTLNLMTLGGLALAIGMLVDDATVEVENIHRNRQKEPRLAVAILDSASQVATPALATTLTVCIVFFPVVLLTGPARSLFVPLALAVVVSMVASYLLSRTLVPAMAHLLMKNEKIEGAEGEGEEQGKGKGDEGGKPSLWVRINRARARAFDRFESAYETALRAVLYRRALIIGVMVLLLASAGLLSVFVGLDFFPSVDTGLMKIHFRAPIGTRIEDTEVMVADVERRIRAIIPAAELETVNDNVGVPISINYAYIQSDAIGGQDADILIDLKPGHHPTDGYVRRIRAEVAPAFPGSTLYFQPADVISQVLSFGVPSAIDVQVQAKSSAQAYEIASGMLDQVRRVPGAADVHIAQVVNKPVLRVDVDRDRAAQLGLFERDVANSLLTSLSGSGQLNPSFWVSPENFVNYTVAVQTPITSLTTFDDLRATPISLPSGSGASGAPSPNTPPSTAPSPNNAVNGAFTPPVNGDASPYLGSIALLRPSESQAVVNHYTVQPIADIQASVDGRDLGSVARDLEEITKKVKLPKGAEIHIRGQSQAMFQSFGSLALGLVVAIALVYLLLVTLLQSWLDPFIIMTAIPGALVGVLWMLALTGTTLNVESLMGTIMVVGIAVSNSNLLVNFANDLRGDKDQDRKGKGGDESAGAKKGEEKHDEKKGEAGPDEQDESGPRRRNDVTGAKAKPGKGGQKSDEDDEKPDPNEALEAAVEAGRTRLRPVLMTAIAMIIGMVPMALALGEGGEQNAPLGRAVIGGLLVATFVTLFLVPAVYTLLRQKKPQKQRLDEKFAAETAEGAGDEQAA